MKKWLKNITVSTTLMGAVFMGLTPVYAADETAKQAVTVTDAKQDATKTEATNDAEQKVTVTDSVQTDTTNDGTKQVTTDTPVISGLNNKELETQLNSKYLEENKKLFDQFEKEVATMKDFEDPAHLGIKTGYIIKTNTDDLLSIGRYVSNTVGSSSTKMTYDTLDKKNGVLVSLPSLFKDDSYIQIISDNIVTQMKQKMADNDDLTYWLDGYTVSNDVFKLIDANQSFYITKKGKLVICFNKYDVAPGSMGAQEFEIPTKILKNILVSNAYIH